MSESTESSGPVPRGKPLLVMALMILPLILIGVAKYSPWLTRLPKISSISIVPPRVLGPPDADYMADDVPKKLREALGDLPGIVILRSPTAAEVEQAKDDLPKLAGMVGADALVLTSIDVDSGNRSAQHTVVRSQSKPRAL